jgi:hypothetical protein
MHFTRNFAAALCVLTAAPAVAADYSTVDVGDVYYINRFGNNNETVIVVRMLDYPRVKVRNVDTAATVIVDSSDLLTNHELKTEERNNKLLGWGAAGTVAVCLMKGGC